MLLDNFTAYYCKSCRLNILLTKLYKKETKYKKSISLCKMHKTKERTDSTL